MKTDWILAACQAPSADNNQPWIFFVENNKITVALDTGNAHILNFDLISLGAAAENLILASGRQTMVEIGSQGVTIYFSETEKPTDLANFIFCRKTTRQRFQPAPDLLKKLDIPYGVKANYIKNIFWQVFRRERQRFAKEDFHWWRWTQKEAERTSDGLDCRLLGVPPLGGFILRNFKLNSVFALWVACATTSGSIVVLTGDCWVKLGMAVENVWLQCEKLGLAVQPLGSLFVDVDSPRFVFRVGRVAKSLRRAPNIVRA